MQRLPAGSFISFRITPLMQVYLSLSNQVDSLRTTRPLYELPGKYGIIGIIPVEAEYKYVRPNASVTFLAV